MDVWEKTETVPLVAAAGEAETAAFIRACAGQGFILTPASEPLPCTRGRIFFVGRGMGTAATRLWREQAVIPLLVAHDDSVLGCAELIDRCDSVLVAPYDDAALVEHLLLNLGPRVPQTAPMAAMNLAGASPAIRRMLGVASICSRYDTPILLHGETGTGKELVARAIHYSGSRCDQPFVPVNCCALNDDLLLAELFGYEKGAFTDAKRSHAGLVAQAAGGTLFLDEVDSLSPKGQGALLRLLQEQEYRPIGSTNVYRSDVRIVSATNKELEALVAQGLFREDLYYRLHVLHIRVPPLREREGDVAVLAEHFLQQLNSRYGVEKSLHNLTQRWMEEYRWPGNVRELENYLHRVFVLTEGAVICVPKTKGDPVHLTAPDLTAPLRSLAGRSFRDARQNSLEQFERRYLAEMMAATGGNVSEAARRAGKERRAFGKLLKKHGIDRVSFRK